MPRTLADMMRLRMLLNAGYSGPQCWLLLAIARGYLAEAGVALALTPGTGAFNAAPGMVAGGFDLGYGDLHALVDVVAADTPDAPIGVFATFNASPSAIFVARDGPVRRPTDLVGRRLIGHASDVALRSFGAFAESTGIDPRAVQVDRAEGGMAALVAEVACGRADGLFAYVSTVTAALAADRRRPQDTLRWLRYDQRVPDLHGSAVMASARLVREEPALLRRLVAALNRGLVEALADPEAAIAAVLAFAQGADPAVERLRWDTTLAVEMGHPVAWESGYGDVDAPRFGRGLALYARTAGLRRSPDAAEIFTAAFLPAPAQRARRA